MKHSTIKIKTDRNANPTCTVCNRLQHATKSVGVMNGTRHFATTFLSHPVTYVMEKF